MTAVTIDYKETKGFKKDFKKLKKRFRSLDDDLAVVKRNVIELFHLRNINNQSVFLIPGFCSEDIKICKIKKIACKTLKGRGSKSGLRIIYAFHIKIFKVVLIEIYFKADQTNEDIQRIKNYLKLS